METAAFAASSRSAALSDLRMAFFSSGAAWSVSENCKREEGRSLAASPSRKVSRRFRRAFFACRRSRCPTTSSVARFNAPAVSSAEE